MGAFYIDITQTMTRTYKVDDPSVTTPEEARAAYVDLGSIQSSETSPEEIVSVVATAEGV